ncbi:hypothetical protein [Bradyrhizobium sp. Tv2a-2]|uniref:hypothetical protein n=1 Tax=Bradyrhizobium sp. Tv2a-2 TaxID=113395 RepID=UPI000407F55A|nr:hypothetical protein [Bradyrhizobium sp. Tv2a-2]
MSIIEYTEGRSRASLLLHRHRQEAGLEGDDEIILIHLLGDLIEWCDAHRVDFDSTIESSREMLRDCTSLP